MILTWLQLELAGSWSFIWHWGLGIGLIVLLVGAGVFSQAVPVLGPYLHPIRVDLFWAAAAVALLLGGEYIGAHDAARRCQAQTIVVEKRVDRVVHDVAKPKAQKEKDPWNSPQN